MTARFRTFRDWLAWGIGYLDSQTVIDGRKHCSKCRDCKPVEAFPPYSQRRARSGRFWQCRDCLRAAKEQRASARRENRPPRPRNPRPQQADPHAEAARELNRLWRPNQRTAQ